MKAVSPALAAHIAGEATTLATMWRIVRRDGAVFTFTDHDRDLVYGGETYSAALGYQRAAISSGAGLAVDETELLGLLSSDAIEPAHLRAGLWDHAEVRIFAVNYADLSMGELRLRRGRLGEVTLRDDGSFRAELRGMAQPLQQQVGGVYQAECRADLGDGKCRVPLRPPVREDSTAYEPGAFVRVDVLGGGLLTSYDEGGAIWECTTAGTTAGADPGGWPLTPGATILDGSVTWTCRSAWTRPATIEFPNSSVDLLLVADGVQAFADAYFAGGVVIWETGLNAGVVREVIGWNQGGRVLSLFSPPPFAPQAGDVLRVQPGCDKRAATCRATFGNFLNFRGEPFVPGALAILEVPT